MPATATVSRRREEQVESYHDYLPGEITTDEVAVRDYATLHNRLAHEAPGHEHGARYHGSPEDAPTTRARYAAAHRHTPEDEAELLRRFLEEKPAPLSTEEVVEEATRARRRARAPHRPFRLTTTQMIIAGTLLCQLTGILWLQSQALALRNRDQELRKQIALTGQQIAQTKHAIAQLDSENHLTHLAAQMKWASAPVSSLDDVTKTKRITLEEAVALGMATEGERKAKTASAPQKVPVKQKPVVEIAAPSDEPTPDGLVPLDDNLISAERRAGQGE